MNIKHTAYHEAGHAIATLALGKSFRRVTIKPDLDRGSLGHCLAMACRGKSRLSMDMYEGNNRARDYIEKEVQIFLAGNAAECRFTGKRITAGSGNDFSNASELLERICNIQNGELYHYFEFMKIRASSLVTSPHHWFAVERVAAELLDKETLTGKVVKEVYRQSLQEFSFRLTPQEREKRLAEARVYQAVKTDKRINLLVESMVIDAGGPGHRKANR